MPPLRFMPSAAARIGSTLLMVAGLLACGSDSPTGLGTGSGNGGGEGSVASVVVTGAPVTVVLVGDTTRLVATAVNETGGVVSNQTVTWKSSAPTVAAVTTNGTVIALGPGKATITATVSGHDGTAALDIAYGVTVGTQGGTLSASSGAFNLTIPAGGFAQATLLLVRPSTTAPADARVVPGTAFELGPDGVYFQRAGTLSMTFDPAKVPSGLAGESLQLYVQSGSGWAVVPGSTVNLTTKTVTGNIGRSGVYAIRSTPVDHINVTGAAAGGALYVGQTSQLNPKLVGTAGDSLPMRTIAWTTSDASKVTVDATGKITGVSSGSATIVASTDGKSASVNVTVLTRPTANWTNATDWSSYQGNSQHSGLINATVDPTVFRERWVTTPAANITYYQPTTGGGRLYLATASYFGGQQLIALDPNDGSRMWVRDFGAIFGINQPTYFDGTLYMTSGGHEDTYMWAINEADGSLRFQTAFSSQWEHWKAPVISGSTVVTAGGYYGGMYGFDRATGKQTFFMSGPQVDGWGPVAANGLVYATGYTAGGGVRAVDPTSGTITDDMIDSRLNAVTTPVIGESNDLLTIIGGRLVKMDLATKKVAWEQSGSYTGMPVVGGGVVYGASGSVMAARRESDGTLLWSWTPPAPSTVVQGMVLTNNTLFVSTAGGYGATGMTYAIDLQSHLAVWSYPLNGDLAMSKEGVLYIVQNSKVAAISVR